MENYYHLCNNKFDNGNNIFCISSSIELAELKAEPSIKAWLINAHLTWDNKNPNDNYGFDIARLIRMNLSSKFPIVIYSPLQRTFFEHESQIDVKYKVLYGRGTEFLLLDEVKDSFISTVEKLNKYPLSDAVIADMNEMLFNQKGVIIDKLTHELQFRKIECRNEKLKVVLDGAAAFMTASQLNLLDWDNFSTKLIESISDSVKFNKIAVELIQRCEMELINDAIFTEIKPERRHKILVLEDDPDFQIVIDENLNNHFVKLLITGSAEKAIELLQGDGKNDITGIISDWRLYSDPNEKTYWQLQGYEVLDYAAKNRLIALFALTSLSDRNVHNIRNTLGLDINLFKKQHLETSDSKVQWEMMADIVRQKCDSVRNIIDSTPTGARWTLDYYDKSKNERVFIMSLKMKYSKARNSLSWSTFESYICNKANDLWYYYSKVLNDECFDLRSLSSVKEKFGYELAAKEPELNIILIVRRVYLALMLSAEKIYHSYYRVWWESTEGMKLDRGMEESPVVNVYCVLTGINWETFLATFTHKLDKKKGNVIMTKEEQASERFLEKAKSLANLLCITLEVLPNEGILPEERSWLSKKGIDVKRGNSVFDYEAISEDSNVDQRGDAETDSFDVEPTDDEIGMRGNLDSFEFPLSELYEDDI